MMNHQPFDSWLLDTSDLSVEQTTQLRQHLNTCPVCQQKQAAWQAIENILNQKPVRPATAGFAARFQGSFSQRRRQSQRRQARYLLLALIMTAMLIATILVVRLFASTSLSDLIGSGVHFLTNVPQVWLNLRFIVSFWIPEIPPGLLILSVVIVAGWSLLILVTWFLTMIRLTTQGVTNR